LKYELRDFLRGIAEMASGRVNSRKSFASGIAIRRPR
jgi:hypothetical protein